MSEPMTPADLRDAGERDPRDPRTVSQAALRWQQLADEFCAFNPAADPVIMHNFAGWLAAVRAVAPAAPQREPWPISTELRNDLEGHAHWLQTLNAGIGQELARLLVETPHYHALWKQQIDENARLRAARPAPDAAPPPKTAAEQLGEELRLVSQMGETLKAHFPATMPNGDIICGCAMVFHPVDARAWHRHAASMVANTIAAATEGVGHAD